MGNQENTEEKKGCLRPIIGWIVLLLAIAAVLFFCIAKPELEERGIDVESKLDEIKADARELGGKVADGARQGIDAVKEKAPEVAARAKNAWQNGKEKAGDAVDAAKEQAGDAADAAQDGVEEIKQESSEWID